MFGLFCAAWVSFSWSLAALSAAYPILSWVYKNNIQNKTNYMKLSFTMQFTALQLVSVAEHRSVNDNQIFIV